MVEQDSKKAKEAGVPAGVAVTAGAKAVKVVDEAEVEKALRKSVYSVMGIGVLPLPFIGAAATTTANLLLVRKLAKLYGIEFKEGAAKNIIVSVTGAAAGAIAAPVLATAIIGVPLVGFPLAVGSQTITYGMTTYAIGRMFISHFERGGGFIGANIDAMKEDFSTAFKSSREWMGDTISGRKKAEAKAV
ncbi:MAG: YcjF family protein [Chitinispirillales bacterium]|jgi:uncharacterized protein (DUF697 family)|nr:YcjF family protein [Chitinispirillales bacterium]